MVAISAAHTDKRVTTCAVTKGLSAAAMGKTVEGAAVMLVGPVAMLLLGREHIFFTLGTFSLHWSRCLMVVIDR